MRCLAATVRQHFIRFIDLHQQRNELMRFLTPFSILCLAAGGRGLMGAAQLQPGTVKAWEEYVHSAEERIQTVLTSQRPFLWLDRLHGWSRQQERTGWIDS